MELKKWGVPGTLCVIDDTDPRMRPVATVLCFRLSKKNTNITISICLVDVSGSHGDECK